MKNSFVKNILFEKINKFLSIVKIIFFCLLIPLGETGKNKAARRRFKSYYYHYYMISIYSGYCSQSFG